MSAPVAAKAEVKDSIAAEYESVRAIFQTLLDSLSDADVQKLKAFAWILNALTGPFNWINGLGARGGSKFFRKKRLGPKFDKVYASMLRKLNSVGDDEWRRGMYFPEKWDGLFKKYMTLEDVLRFPVVHFRFHLDQIAR